MRAPAPARARESEPAYQLPELPYQEDALEPVISAETIRLHHGKHHKAYVDAVNRLVQGTELARLPLDKLLLRVADDAAHSELFNNAAQAWNHAFYWHSLTPKREEQLSELLAERLNAGFGTVAEFKNQFVKAAVAQFGSGWAWLALDRGQLRIITTGNAQNPLTMGATPLLGIDVWEHAYYLDYQNRRAEYVRAVVETLLNWRFASSVCHTHFK